MYVGMGERIWDWDWKGNGALMGNRMEGGMGNCIDGNGRMEGGEMGGKREENGEIGGENGDKREKKGEKGEKMEENAEIEG